MPATVITAKYLPLQNHESERKYEKSGNQNVAIIWNCKKGNEFGRNGNGRENEEGIVKIELWRVVRRLEDWSKITAG